MTSELWHVVRSCLAKRPEDRPTAADLARRLENLTGRRRPLHPPRLRRPGRRVALVAVVAGCALAGVPVAAWLASPRPHPAANSPGPAQQPAAALSLTPAIGPILAPDGGCLDDRAAVSTDGNPVQNWVCNKTNAQEWTVGVGGTLRVLNRCLRATGTPDGAVQIWTCDGTAAQQWRLRPDGALVNVGTGTCLESTGGRGARPALHTCTGSANQRWKLP